MNDRKKPFEYPSKNVYINTNGLISVDPLGSYTGRAADDEETPVQDADDL